MAEVIDGLVVRIGGDNSGLVNASRASSVALKGVEASAMSLGDTLRNVGAAATATITAPLAIIGRLGMDSLQSVEKSLRSVALATGRTGMALEIVKKQLMDMSRATGNAPEELAEGYATLEKRGFGAASSMSILGEALKLAKGTSEDAGSAVRALSNYLVEIGGGAKEAAAGAALLYRAAGEGQSGLESLVRIIVQARPHAQQLGIDINMLVTAIGAIDKRSANARGSVGAIQQLLANFVRPSADFQKVWQKAFGEMPSYTMRVRGLSDSVAKLLELNKAVGIQEMSKIGFGGAEIRALEALKNVDLSAFSDNQANIELMNKRLKDATTPLANEISKLRNEYKLMAMEVASTLMPVFKAMTGIVRSLMGVWGSLSEPARKFTTYVISATVAIGPLLMAITRLILLGKNLGVVGAGLGSLLFGPRGATGTAAATGATGSATSAAVMAAAMMTPAAMRRSASDATEAQAAGVRTRLAEKFRMQAMAEREKARDMMAAVPWQAYFNRDEKGRWRDDKGKYIPKADDPLYQATRQSRKAYDMQKAYEAMRESGATAATRTAMARSSTTIRPGDMAAYMTAVEAAGKASKEAAKGVTSFGGSLIQMVKGVGPVLARGLGLVGLALAAFELARAGGAWLGEKMGAGTPVGDATNLLKGEEAREKRRLMEQEALDTAARKVEFASASKLQFDESMKGIRKSEMSGAGLMEFLKGEESSQLGDVTTLIKQGMQYTGEYYTAMEKLEATRAEVRREELAQLERDKSLQAQVRSAKRGAMRPAQALESIVDELSIAAAEVEKARKEKKDTAAQEANLLSVQEQARGMFSERVGRARQRVQDALEGRAEKTWTAQAVQYGSQEWGQAVLDRGQRQGEARKIEQEQLMQLKLIKDAMQKIPGVVESIITPYELAEITL